MARWTPEQLKEKLAFWIDAENVVTEKTTVYGQEVEFVIEALDLSGNKNSAYNLDDTNVTRPIIVKDSINGRPAISFGNFNLSKIGEGVNTFGTNDFVIPDYLMINHSEKVDLSGEGGSIFIVFKPNLKREIAFRFIYGLNSEKYNSSQLRSLILSGDFSNLTFPTDAEIESALTVFESNGITRSSNIAYNDLTNLIPTMYSAPGFEIKLKIDDMYYNSEASNFSSLNSARQSLGMPSLVSNSEGDTLGTEQLDYITERPSSGIYKIETTSVFGSSEEIVSNLKTSNSSSTITYTSELEIPSNLETAFSSLGIETGPNFNESFDDRDKVYRNTELFRSSNSNFYEPISQTYSILSIVTNSRAGSIDTTGGVTRWQSPSTRSGFFKNGEHFGGNNSLISVPKTSRYSNWVHAIGAPLDKKTGKIKGGYDSLAWNTSKDLLTDPKTLETQKLKEAFDSASRYGSSFDDDTSDFFSGDIAEIIVFKEELSEENRELVEGYLSFKYGIDLVAGHEYENTAPSYDETNVVWSPLEEKSLAMWVDSETVSSDTSSLSRFINSDSDSRDYYVDIEDISSYYNDLEDDSVYVKQFIDKSENKINLVSLQSPDLSSKSWPLFAAKSLSSEINSKPAIKFEKVPSTSLEYDKLAGTPQEIKRGEFSNIVKTNTTAQIRQGGFYVKATPIDSEYNYPNRDGLDWIQASTLFIRNKDSMFYLLKRKPDLYDVSKFEAYITLESGLGENYFQSGDLVLVKDSDMTHFGDLYDNDGLYEVLSYDNSNGELKIDLYTKYQFTKTVPFSSNKKIGFAPNPIGLGSVTKVNLNYAQKSGIPYYVATSESFRDFKTEGGSIFLVMKPDQTEEKRVLLSNGRYDNGSSPIWITSGGSSLSGGSSSAPSQLRFAFDSDGMNPNGVVSFSVDADGAGTKYYQVTFDNSVAGTSSTSFDETNGGDNLANAYTATIYTFSSMVDSQSDVIDDLFDLFTGGNFVGADWTLTKVTSQQAGVDDPNTQLNITGTDGDVTLNFSNLTESVSNMAITKVDALAGSDATESGTASISLNGYGEDGAVSTSSYNIFEFVFPGFSEDVSSLSNDEKILRFGIWKDGVKQSNDYPDQNSWGTKESRDDNKIYICPPISEDDFFTGNIAEVIIFTDDLTVDSRQRVEWYLSDKYNIDLPGAHPYFSTDPLTTQDIKWSPADDPNDLFAWYAPDKIEDNGSESVRWKDKHGDYKANNDDERHLNTIRSFTQYQPNPESTEVEGASIPVSDILSDEINGNSALRIRAGKGLAFYGFLRTMELNGFSAFMVLKYNESNYLSSNDYHVAEDGSIIELANLFHNPSDSSPKTNYHLSISDTIDGYATGGYDNNLETVFLDGSNDVDQQRTSTLAESDSINSNVYQIVSLVSRDPLGQNTRESGVYLNGVSKGKSETSSFETDTISISGGNHDITVAEIIFYNKELSDFDRQRVEGYLACKFDLQSQLDSSHPYKEFCPEREAGKTLFSIKPLSVTNTWNPKLSADLLSIYTPDNITYLEDHSKNGFSFKIAPILNDNSSLSHIAVAGVKFDGSQDYKLHSSVENLAYEVAISNDLFSEDDSTSKISSIRETISSLFANLYPNGLS
jgi:hypothetical protein